MEKTAERLEPRLRESALIMLRRHGMSEDDLQFEANEPGHPVFTIIRGHRVRIELNDQSAAFKVLAGRWSGDRMDFPSTGAFIAAFEEALNDAFAK
jgi:hypothetical protein